MKIEPALSSDEWADIAPNDMPSLLSHYGDGVDMLADLLGQRRSVEQSRHALIALANHALPDEHPGKITAAGIDNAVALVDLLDDPSRYWGGMGDDERNELHASFDRLIAALRSLLPEPSAPPRGGA